MKKLIYGGLLIAAIGIGFIGCEKESGSLDSNHVNGTENIVQQKSQIDEFKPTNYENIGKLFGIEHNAVLNYVLIEDSCQNQSDLYIKFKDYYQNSSMSSFFSSDLSANILPELNTYFFDKDKFIDKLNSIKYDFDNLVGTSSNEKQKFALVIECAKKFANDGAVDDFISSLKSIENDCIQEKSNIILTNPNQEYVKVLSVIGIALHSAEYCLSRSAVTGINNIPPMPNGPAGIAPWVIADLGGAAVGAVMNAGNYAVSGGDHSWSGFAFDVVGSGLVASGGCWIARWLW